MTKWIKFADRMLPEDKGSDLRVMTWDGYTVRENVWIWSTFMHRWTWTLPSPRPTHWMHLPQPPN
jgi:hypothetical protein